MKVLKLYIILTICLCLNSCLSHHSLNWSSIYSGDGKKVWLKSDSTAIVDVRIPYQGNNKRGKWYEDDKYIKITFPNDSLYYKDIDIAKFLSHPFIMETIILEKDRKGHLLWRNIGNLKRKK